METEVLFHETQQFRDAGMWLAIAAIAVIAIGVPLLVGARRGAMTRLPFMIPVVVATIVLAGVGVLLWTARLETRVAPSGIDVQFSPFHRSPRHIAWSDVREVRTATIRPIRDWGGWGIRRSGHGTAYLVGGNRCLEIVRANGTTLCIGTQQPEKLESAVSLARSRTTQ